MSTDLQGLLQFEVMGNVEVVGCPLSDSRKNQGPKRSFEGEGLLCLKECEGSAVIVEPFDDFQSMIDVIHHRSSDGKKITDDKVDLMHPA